MTKQSILDYVDSVMSNVEAPKELKAKIENELIRYIMEASENSSVEEVKRSLVSPEKLAEELSKKLVAERPEERPAKGPAAEKPYRRHHYQRYVGEFMQERNNVNIKLLYIPLIQIASGTTRVIMPLTDDEDDED